MNLMTVASQNYFWLPTQGSDVASEIDFLFNAILAISTIAFVGIVIAMVLFCIWYRRRDGYVPQPSPSHSTSLELIWTIVPSIFLIWIFARGVYGFQLLNTEKEDAPTISVTAKQFGWEFVYPNGEITEELHLSRNQPVRLQMTSNDVIHSFYVPSFRVKMDVIPKRYHSLYFKPTKTSTSENPFWLKCAEYCGENHSEMKKKVIVHDVPWDEMLRKNVNWKEEEYSEMDNGRRLFKIHCAGCHSTDGSTMTGPSFKEFLTRDHVFQNGSEKLNFKDKDSDDFFNYLRKSLDEPEFQVVQGYANQMTSFQGKFSPNQLRYLRKFLVKVSRDGMSKDQLDQPFAKDPEAGQKANSKESDKPAEEEKPETESKDKEKKAEEK